MRSLSSRRAVSISTAVRAVAGSARNSSMTSSPERPGSIRSRTISDGLSPRAAARPSGPPAAVTTSRPAFPTGTRFLRIIATNDFHGALEPRPDPNGVRRGGAAYVAAAIDRARNECVPHCEILLLDAGDLFQGTPASNLAFGRPVIDFYNRMGYAAAALGNHEFDWGVDSLRARMRQANFGIFGANVRYTDGRDVEWIPNDTIVTRSLTRIGIVGLSTVT